MLSVHAALWGVTGNVRWPWLPELTLRDLFWMRLEAESLVFSATPWSAVRNLSVYFHIIVPVRVELRSAAQRPAEPALGSDQFWTQRPGPLQLDKPECICTKAHETHRVGTSLCLQGGMLDVRFWGHRNPEHSASHLYLQVPGKWETEAIRDKCLCTPGSVRPGG